MFELPAAGGNDGVARDGQIVTGQAWPDHPKWLAQFLEVSQDGHRPRRTGGRRTTASPITYGNTGPTPATPAQSASFFRPVPTLEYERWDGRQAVHQGFATTGSGSSTRRRSGELRLPLAVPPRSEWPGNFPPRHAGERTSPSASSAISPLSLFAFFRDDASRDHRFSRRPTSRTRTTFRASLRPSRLLRDTTSRGRTARRLQLETRRAGRPPLRRRHLDRKPSFPPLAIDSETAILSDGEQAVTETCSRPRAVLERPSSDGRPRHRSKHRYRTPGPWRQGILAPRCWRKGVIVLPGDEGGAAERGTYAVSSGVVESIRSEPHRSRCGFPPSNTAQFSQFDYGSRYNRPSTAGPDLRLPLVVNRGAVTGAVQVSRRRPTGQDSP